MIVDEPGANARHFVGNHRRADPTAANSHASIHLAGHYGLRERHHEVGIIVKRVQAMGAEVHYLVPSRIQFGHEFFFESEPTMIGSNSNPHAIFLSAAALSASSTALFCTTRPAGIDGSAACSRLNIGTFSLTVTRKRMQSARLLNG